MARQTGGFTPLYIASQSGHVECVRALLDGGAAVNQAMVGSTSSMARHGRDCVCGDAWEAAGMRACTRLDACVEGYLRVVMEPMPYSR